MTEPRFKTLTLDEMDAAQRPVAEAILAGPRGGMRGPFNALLRSPELCEHAQRLGAYIRFGSSIPKDLNEIAILLVARKWTAQFEWYAHRELALAAGLPAHIPDAIAAGRRPDPMTDDARIVYEFCHELLTTTQVSDATFSATTTRFGEKGVMDLIGAMGYYSLVSMVLNIDRVPLPEGVAPLPPLPG